jgi:hypothetical protein
MTDDLLLDRICEELIGDHAVHTIFLYGSRADGSAGPDSDYDIAAFAPIAAPFRIARPDPDGYLDVFVYPQARLRDPGEDFLNLRGSRIVIQRGADGDDCLGALDAVFARGPTPLPADELEARRVWAHKMAARIDRGDAEGNYRRAWLLQALLEDYFLIRGRWYEGPKKALRGLEKSEPPVHEAFVVALTPGASNEAVRALVDLVAGGVPRAG